MNVHFMSAPVGFSAAINLMNAADPSSFETFVGEVFEQERLNAGRLGLVAQRSKVGAIPSAELLGVANALGYIYRGCQEHGVGSDGAPLIAALGAVTEASEATAAVLVKSWAASSSAATSGDGGGSGNDAVSKALKLGQLVGLEWTLGVALASSSCPNLSAPFVKLSFHVTDASGGAVIQVVELSYTEFTKMSATLKEVASKLDRL